VGARFPAPVQTSPGTHQASCTMGTRSFLGVKRGRGVTLTPSPPSTAMVMKGLSYTSTPPMGHSACTEPQCLYEGALYRTACTEPQCPYNGALYRTACTEPQCLYKGALYLYFNSLCLMAKMLSAFLISHMHATYPTHCPTHFHQSNYIQ
jgi:hypothetical protein